MTVSFLDVGEADCSLIKTPSGNAVMIDTGYSNRQTEVLNQVESLGVFRLDCLILSHPHEDHIQLAPNILDYMPVSRLIIADTKTNELLESVVAKAKEKDVPVHICSRGESFTLDGVEFLFLSDGSEVGGGDNSSSILRVCYQTKTFLFTGDAEINQEKELLSSGLSVDADVIKVGHHGSKTSTSMDFLNEVTPRFAVISVGASDNFQHPDYNVIERLRFYCRAILRTDQNGRIDIVTDGLSLKVFSQKQ